MAEVFYTRDKPLTVEQFVDVLKRSTLGERRPVADLARIAQMLKHANLLVSAWDGDLLLGVARSLTDFTFCCYLSDLAVDAEYQGRGIGTELIRFTQGCLEADCKVILLSAPKAEQFYPKIGMSHHHSAWVAPALPLIGQG